MSEIRPIFSYPTNAGLALIAKAVARGIPITITRAAVGRGRAPEGTQYAMLADLVEPIEGAGVYISGKRFEPGNPSANVTVQALLGQLVEGYTYTEVAVYAHEPDTGEEILFIYTPRYEYPATVFPATSGSGGGSISETTVVIAVSGVSEMTITVSPGAMLTIAEGDQRYAFQQHRHRADDIDEGNGETVEESQRRQDAMLEGMGQVTGTTQFDRAFDTPGAQSLWVMLEGILDGATLTTGGEGVG